MLKHRLIVPAVVAALLSGCKMAPKYERPAAPVPGAFPSGGAYGQQPAGQGALASELSWREFYSDPKLAEVIAAALNSNRDLRLASLNVTRAHELYGVQRSELYPTANAGAGANRQHTSGDLAASGKGKTSEVWSANLGVAAWEIDFFGRIRSLSDAALQQYFATEQAQRTAQMIIVANVARAYLTLAADSENLKLAQTTLTSQQEAYKLVNRRFELGLTPELDVHRAATQVATAEVDVARYTQLVALDHNAPGSAGRPAGVRESSAGRSGWRCRPRRGGRRAVVGRAAAAAGRGTG